MRTWILAALLPLAASAEVVIRWEAGAFRVTGLAAVEPAEGWASLISVYAGSADVPPMTGSFAVENGALLFRPRYPLTPGVEYRAVYHPPHVDSITFVIQTAPAAAASPARVENVYPASDVLPANLLRLYVEFSQPMARGEAWKHLRLLREDGTPVQQPFLDQELWTQDQRRLTVLLDPGRVKRGVAEREANMSEVLTAGVSYTLVIGPGLLDANGRPLAEEFRRTFRAGPAIREGIDPRQWRVFPPAANSSAPLIVEFDRPMDWALVQRCLQVAGMAGDIEAGRGESRWQFTPEQPWRAGRYQILIDAALEDPAGNRIGRPFDVDLGTNSAPPPTAAALSFEIR